MSVFSVLCVLSVLWAYVVAGGHSCFSMIGFLSGLGFLWFDGVMACYVGFLSEVGRNA